MGREVKNQVIVLAERPKGKVNEHTFKLKDLEMPELKDGQVLLKSLVVSLDPGMRGFMDKKDDDDRGKTFELNEAITSRTVAQIVESKNLDFKKGEIVYGRLPWKIFQAPDPKDLEKVDPDLAPISTALSILGVTGLAAYFGILNVGKIKKGDTVVVSGAAGAVGSVASQIAKINGCRVVGIAGSQQKITYLEEELGLDKGINYKTTDNLKKAIAEACPNGVDVFFDNVGDETFDAVFANINKHGKMIICGQISDYNESDPPRGPRPQHDLIKYSASIEGFVVFDFKNEFDEAKKQLAEWYNNGKLKYKENMIEGFENLPSAFIGLFSGDNIGKQLVHIADAD